MFRKCILILLLLFVNGCSNNPTNYFVEQRQESNNILLVDDYIIFHDSSSSFGDVHWQRINLSFFTNLTVFTTSNQQGNYKLRLFLNDAEQDYATYVANQIGPYGLDRISSYDNNRSSLYSFYVGFMYDRFNTVESNTSVVSSLLRDGDQISVYIQLYNTHNLLDYYESDVQIYTVRIVEH